MQIIVKTNDSGAQVWHLQLTKKEASDIAAIMTTTIFGKEQTMEFGQLYQIAPTKNDALFLITEAYGTVQKRIPLCKDVIEIPKQIMVEQARLSTRWDNVPPATFGQA